MRNLEELFDNIYFIYFTAFVIILFINKGAGDIYELAAIAFWALLALPLMNIILFIIEVILSFFKVFLKD